MIKSQISLTGRKRIRKSFGSISEVAKMPNLIDVQKASYEKFLSLNNNDVNQGLYRVFDSVFPISDFALRKNYSLFKSIASPITMKELSKISEEWKPFRSIAAWYLWRYKNILN